MPCFKCNGYWVCDGKALSSSEVCGRAQIEWIPKGEATGPGKVWCRPGSKGSPCDAKIQEDPPGATPPWHHAGDIGPGSFYIFCRPGGVGGGETCQVKLEEKSEVAS